MDSSTALVGVLGTAVAAFAAILKIVANGQDRRMTRLVDGQTAQNKQLLEHILRGNGDPNDERPNLMAIQDQITGVGTRVDTRIDTLEHKLPCLDEEGCAMVLCRGCAEEGCAKRDEEAAHT